MKSDRIARDKGKDFWGAAPHQQLPAVAFNMQDLENTQAQGDSQLEASTVAKMPEGFDEKHGHTVRAPDSPHTSIQNGATAMHSRCEGNSSSVPATPAALNLNSKLGAVRALDGHTPEDAIQPAVAIEVRSFVLFAGLVRCKLSLQTWLATICFAIAITTYIVP